MALIVFISLSGCASPSLHDSVRKADFGRITKQLAAGVDVNQRDEFGRTPLMIALDSGATQLAEALLVSGANPNLVDAKGKTAITYARDFQARRLLFLAGASMKQVPVSCICDSMEHFQFFMSNGLTASFADEDHRTLLHEAASRGEYEMAQYLLDRDVNVDARDRWDWTPLMYCAGTRKQLLRYFIDLSSMPEEPISAKQKLARERTLQVARLLVEHGCDVNVAAGEYLERTPDRPGTTVLAYAVRAGDAGLVELLLGSGAQLGDRSRKTLTPERDSDCCGSALWEARRIVEKKNGATKVNQERRDIMRMLEDAYWEQTFGDLEALHCYKYLFPAGKYNSDEALWLAAERDSSREGYELYLKQYSRGRFSESARERVDAFRESEKAARDVALRPAFAMAEQIGTDDAYLTFIKAHPGSEHVKVAAARLRGYRVHSEKFVLAWGKIPHVWVGSARNGTDYLSCGITLEAFTPLGRAEAIGTGLLAGSSRYCKSNEMRLHLSDWVSFDGYQAVGSALITEEGLVFLPGSVIVEKK